MEVVVCFVYMFLKAARKDKTVVPSVQETVKRIIRGQVGIHHCTTSSAFMWAVEDTRG